MRRLWWLKEQHKEEHELVQKELARSEQKIVDLAVRLVRLEAEVDIYRPFFIEDKEPE